MENTSVLYVMVWIQIVVIITEFMPLQNRNSAPAAAQRWTRNGYERTEYERTNYVFCCCNDYVGFKPENDIGIKTFVDNYKYCRSCGSRMLGVVEFRAK